MGRSRSRSPRRKERRRSRSRERSGVADTEKKLDKFGRDVGRSDRRIIENARAREDFSRIYERNGSSGNDSRGGSGIRGGGGGREFVRDHREKERFEPSPAAARYDSSNGRYDQPPAGRYEDRPVQRQPPPPPQDTFKHGHHGQQYYDNKRYDNESQNEQRQQFKEMFEEREAGVDDETRKMQQLMGFGNFDTTKNKKQTGNPSGYAKINRTQKYRQYMNRRGGFNRPLDWVG